ncbi:hypothetical protein [Endozoicomonas numazuensis]|nr:hypothetical protein [Endozoicomonas numazuensis]
MNPISAFSYNNPLINSAEHISLDSATPVCIDQLYRQGKILVKMISNTYEPHDRLDNELSELLSVGIIRSASTSLLAYQAGSKLFRDIGLILNSDKCNIQDIFPSDAGSFRVNPDGDRVAWNSIKKTFCTSVFGKPQIETEYQGDFRVGEHAKKLKIKDSSELVTYLKSKYQETSFPIPWNEVVVDYNKESIFGLIATQNVLYPLNSEERNAKTIHHLQEIKEIMRSRLQLDLPIYIYDCITGSLSAWTNA